jgi:hypothetical protein
MKRFNFPLDRVRNWRHDQAEIEEMRLRQMYTEMRAVEADRKALVEEADRSRRAVLAQHYVTALDLSSLEAFHEYAVEQLRRLDAKRREVETRIQEQQVRVLEAHRSFQLLDGLRDRALVSWTAARDKEQEELAAELFLAKRSQEIRESRRQGARQSRSHGVRESRNQIT